MTYRYYFASIFLGLITPMAAFDAKAESATMDGGVQIHLSDTGNAYIVFRGTERFPERFGKSLWEKFGIEQAKSSEIEQSGSLEGEKFCWVGQLAYPTDIPRVIFGDNRKNLNSSGEFLVRWTDTTFELSIAPAKQSTSDSRELQFTTSSEFFDVHGGTLSGDKKSLRVPLNTAFQFKTKLLKVE
jgi:hypothetical protein